MKYQYAVLLATAGLAAAGPHNHQHRRHAHHHIDRRDDVVYVKETKIVYVLDGVEISEDEVQKGYANGTLVMGDGGKPERPDPVTSAASGSSTSSAKSSSAAQSASPLVMAEAKVSSAAAQATSAVVSVASIASSLNIAGYSGVGSGLDTPFENGKLDCNTFPSAYGAIAIPWTKLGGFTGIQIPKTEKDSCYDDIFQPDHGTQNPCTEGAYCSYACPAGYQKAAWPKKQGCTHQSIGGLLCKGGKLYLPDGSGSSTLCIPSDDNVQVKLVNKMSSSGTSLCATDYPGKEDQTVPLWVGSGSSQSVCTNNQQTYYKWTDQNNVVQKTTKQWYLNNPGVGLTDACWWNTPGSDMGNYSPACLGTGYDPDMGQNFISLSQNSPSSYSPLKNNVEIVTSPSSKQNGYCAWVYDSGKGSGQFCSSYSNGQYSNCNSAGCTVAVSKGATAYVIMRDAGTKMSASTD